MADDITLTVRVRDLTRGQFDDVRRRMRGMDGDIRRLGQASDLTSERAQRLGREIQGVSGRLGQMSQTGRMARHEMTFMRRTMGLLGRDLNVARRAGELSREEFNDLRRQLDETGLGFDRLMRDVERHNAIAQRAHRAELTRQREAERARRDAEREAARTRREEAVAARRAEAEERRRQREAERRARQLAQLRTSLARQTARDEERARREAERFRQAAARQAEAEARRAETLLRRRQRAEAAAAAAAQRQQQAAFRRDVGRLAGAGGDNGDLAARFRGLGDAGNARLTRGLSQLSNALSGVSGNSDRARRNIGALNNDLRVMSQVLQNAQRDGNLTQRELNALSNGLRLVDHGARSLRRSGDLSRSALRDMRREVSGLQAQLRLLGGEGTRLSRLDDRLLLIQRRLRDVDGDASRVRRVLSRLDSGAAGALRGVTMLAAGFAKIGSLAKINTRWTAIFLAVLVLLGPAAQALGVLLTTALGGAFIALGGFALRGEKTVRSAFNRMRGTIGSTVRAAAQPLRGPLVTAMDEVGAAFRRMGPALSEAFGATAPLVKNFVGAFTDLAAKAMPGVITALKQMGPVIQGFRMAMGSIGAGIGEMFAAMTGNGGAEALKNVWLVLGREIRNLLVNIGEFINFAAKSESATLLLVGAFRLLSGILHVVEAGLASLDGMLNNVMAAAEGLAGPFLKLFGLDGDLPSLADMINPQDSAWAASALDAIAAAHGNAAAKAREQATAVGDLFKQIQGLGNINRDYLDAQAAQANALREAKEKMGQYSNALKMTGGQLDLTTEAGYEAYQLLTQLAARTQESTNKAMEANAPWEKIRSNWQNGFNDLVALADGMGLTKDEARGLAEEILGIPPTKDLYIQARVEEARTQIQSVLEQFERTPDKEFVTVEALTDDATRMLESLGFKITRLPDGKTKVTAATGGAEAAIAYIRNLMNQIDGMTSTTYVSTVYSAINKGLSNASGALSGTARGGLAGYASGGNVQFAPEGFVSGPGSGMSDSIVAAFASGAVGRISNTEYVVNAEATRKNLPLLEAINSGRLTMSRFAKGGLTKRQKAAKKRAEAEREARRDAIPDLTISHFGRMAGYKNDEFRTALAKPDSLNDLVDSLNKWRSIIKKATHGGVERNLLRKLDSAGKSLIRWEKKLSSVEKSLEKAKDKLNDLRESAKQMRESVRSGVLTATNITQAASGEGPVTVAGIMSQMRQGVDKSTAFAQALKDLKAKGVNKTIIEQIAEAGIEGGGLETAGALLSASSSELATINEMQSQINASATSAGKTAADALYGAGIKAAEGLVKGLEKKKKAIEKTMMDIAKSMEKAIKKALGIKSPSKVMEKVGHFTAEGFVVGMEKNRRAATAWDSMLNVRSTGGADSRYTPTGPQVIQVMIGNKVLDEIILDSNRRTVRTRGGNVQAIFSQRG